MKFKLHIWLPMLLLMLSASCTDTVTATVDAEETAVSRFIEEQLKDTTTVLYSKEGVSYVMRQFRDTTETIEKGDSVYIWYVAQTLNNYAFSTNVKEIADSLGLAGTFEPLKIVVGKSGLVRGVDAGLLLMHPYDYGLLIFKSNLGYGDNYVGVIPPNTPLCFQIVIEKHIKKQ